ncbi:MAG: ATP-binding cassette domain-containing protein [Bdellovibrionales bacterium]|nr:ATP-binding cassette domain-containing protein [Bdellovibrionales bacterium]
MKSALLKVENLSKTYTPGELVWGNVGFDLAKGDFLYILGGSGAGKSSLLRILASFENPSQGRVLCHGVDLQDSSRTDLERVRKRVAYIPQNLGLIRDLTIHDHIEMTQSMVPSGDRLDLASLQGYLKLMNLEDKWNKKVGVLSGGERQRVAILRALCRKTDLIIADEPTGAQDFEMTWKLMDLFVKLNLTGTTMLLATHDLEMVRRLRKRCAILKDGTFKVEDRV